MFGFWGPIDGQRDLIRPDHAAIAAGRPGRLEHFPNVLGRIARNVRIPAVWDVAPWGLPELSTRRVGIRGKEAQGETITPHQGQQRPLHQVTEAAPALKVVSS